MCHSADQSWERRRESIKILQHCLTYKLYAPESVLLLLLLLRHFGNLFRACALFSPVIFLTGGHVVQIGFCQISPSASSTRDLGTRLQPPFMTHFPIFFRGRKATVKQIESSCIDSRICRMTECLRVVVLTFSERIDLLFDVKALSYPFILTLKDTP